MSRDSHRNESLSVHLEGVGDILLERSRRARHICLSVRPFKGVRIAVPHGVSYDAAMDVARAKADWIIKHVERMSHVEKQASPFHGQAPINRSVARRVLVDRVETLAKRHGFSYNRVFVRNQKTRWGSCSAVDNINLNVNLIRLPKALRDYVILHELVHTRIKDHGPKFWNELGKYIDDPHGVDRALLDYEPMLMFTE